MDKFGVFWFAVSAVVVTWDALFIILRPQSLPGGDLHFIFKPYALYIEIDTRYKDMEDTFGIAQSWCNLVEAVLSFVTVYLLLSKNRGAYLCGFLVSTMTFWKTVLYFLQYTSLCNGGHMLAHNTWAEILSLFIIPNGIWIFIPFYFMFSYGKVLKSALEKNAAKKTKKH